MEEKRNPRRWPMWIAVAIVMLVAYPLSIGPSMVLEKHGYLPQHSGRWMYFPLGYLADRNPWVWTKVVQYLMWWDDRFPI